MQKINKCNQCGEKIGFFTKYTCKGCGQLLCDNCIVKLDLFDDIIYNEFLEKIPDFKFSLFKLSKVACKNCAYKITKLNSKIDNAFNNSYKIKYYSSNYRGRIKHSIDQYLISTQYYRDKNYAQNLLKAKAYFLNCRIIYNAHYVIGRGSEPSNNGSGTHYYSTFQYVGIATNKAGFFDFIRRIYTMFFKSTH